MSAVLATWVLMLLTAVAVTFGAQVRADVAQARRLDWRMRTRALAESGLAAAQALLMSLPTTDHDQPVDGWGYAPQLARVPVADEGYFSVGYACDTAGPGTTTYGVEDENRRLPLAALTPYVVTSLPGLSADARRLLLARVTRLRPPATIEELSAGLDDASRRVLATLLTPHVKAGVNVHSASREVLTALGIPPTAVGAIIQYRNGADGLPGTADDRGFTTLSDPEGGLRACRLSPEDAAIVSLLASKGDLRTTATAFRVRAHGWTDTAVGFCEVEAVLRRVGGDFETVSWTRRWMN